VDPTAFDGLQQTFTIALADRSSRKIVVANQRQHDLERLVDEINDIVPPKYMASRMGP